MADWMAGISYVKWDHNSAIPPADCHRHAGVSGRIDRTRCEDEEERCVRCRESDAMMDELEDQRRACIRQEQEKQERLVDSAIDMPTSSPSH